MKQKIKDFWWIFIEMGVPLKEIRRLIFVEMERQKVERVKFKDSFNYK